MEIPLHTISYESSPLNLCHWLDFCLLFSPSRLVDKLVAHVKPDAVTLTTLISACAKAGQWEKAVEVKVSNAIDDREWNSAAEM